jgi:hypothetical protein
MNELEIIKWGAYIAAGVLGWFVRILWTAQEKMKEDFNKLEIGLPLVYVRKDEFKEAIREVKDSFRDTVNPILDKLDRTIDKVNNNCEKLHERLIKHEIESNKLFAKRDEQ